MHLRIKQASQSWKVVKNIDWIWALVCNYLCLLILSITYYLLFHCLLYLFKCVSGFSVIAISSFSVIAISGDVFYTLPFLL